MYTVLHLFLSLLDDWMSLLIRANFSFDTYLISFLSARHTLDFATSSGTGIVKKTHGPHLTLWKILKTLVVTFWKKFLFQNLVICLSFVSLKFVTQPHTPWNVLDVHNISGVWFTSSSSYWLTNLNVYFYLCCLSHKLGWTLGPFEYYCSMLTPRSAR
jgi:hypothetical protein